MPVEVGRGRAVRIVARSPLPVFLAGGLCADNVADAIRAVRPCGVDVCSRLRPQGTLDRGLLRRFVSAAIGAAEPTTV